MLAYEGAGGGEGIVLPDQADGVRIPALPDSGGYQGDVAGDVHMGRAQGHAGHRLGGHTGTAAVLHMLHILVPVAGQPLIDHIGRLISNGAVGGFHDRQSRLLHQL